MTSKNTNTADAENSNSQQTRITRINQPLGSGPLQLVVSGIRQLTPTIRAFEFRHPDDWDLPRVKAGSHIDMPVIMNDGTAETRSYSISSNPSRPDIYEIAVLREENGTGGSKYVHDHYQLQQTIFAGMPANGFQLSNDLGPSILIAGGIGITPIKAMTQTLLSRGQDLHLHFAAQSKNMMAYRYKLNAMLADNVTFYASDENARMDLTTILKTASDDTLFYVCGPERLINSVLECADNLGIDRLRVRYEHFAPIAPNDGDQAFTVHIKSSGQTITIPADETVLDTLMDNGIDVEFACQSGACGTCTVKVLDGTPDHRDTTLSDDEKSGDDDPGTPKGQGGVMCVCVSRAKSTSLTLDL